MYRHFPDRAELVVAVYRHQIDECVALAEELTDSTEPGKALETWISAFVEFLVTKHGLGVALQSDEAGFHGLHSLMLDKLVPACGLLVEAADLEELLLSLLDDFVAIDFDENLRHIRPKCCNQGGELWPFARCIQKCLHILREKRDIFARTIFKHERESARCTDARNRRWRKRKCDTFTESAQVLI